MPLVKEQTYTVEDIYKLPDGQRAELIDGRLFDMAPPQHTSSAYIYQIIRPYRTIRSSTRRSLRSLFRSFCRFSQRR